MGQQNQEFTHGWHLDKRVPIAILFALSTQTIGAVWWAATQNARVDDLEEWRLEYTAAFREVTTQVNTQGLEAAVIAQELRSTVSSLDRLRNDVRETNSLLRQMLGAGPRTP